MSPNPPEADLHTAAGPSVGKLHAFVRSWWAPGFVALISICATVFASLHMRELAIRDRMAQARVIEDRVSDEIQDLFHSYTNALYHTRGYVLSSKHVDMHEWKTFVEKSRLETIHPGVWGFGYVQRVEPDGLEPFLEEMRSYGVDDFAIKPSPDTQGNGGPLYIVKYEEPESRNRGAWGLNTAANPVNMAVYDAATDSGLPKLSDPFKLAQVTGDSHLGAVMVAPHYAANLPTETVAQRQEAIVGWLAVVLDFTFFFETEWQPGWDQTCITLTATNSTGNTVVLHEDHCSNSDSHKSSVTTVYPVNLAGSELLLRLELDHSTLHSEHDSLAIVSIVAGGAASFLITAIAFLVARSRTYAHGLAERMTVKLRASEQEQRVMAERAQNASNAKSMFLANMSHEIRTPMTAIIGYSEMIEEMIQEDNADQLREPVHRIRLAGEHLLMIINDILDLSKIESGLFEIAESATDLPDLLTNTVATLTERAQAKGLTLSATHDVPKMVVLDGHRLKQILINLLGNAIKFTESGSVEIQAGVHDQHLVIRVIDTGIGIKQEMLAQIFSPFSQADESMNRRHQGTGLGLSISKSLAALMGGQLSATSEYGRGSEFVVRLPLRIADAYSAAQPCDPPSATAPGQLLQHASTQADPAMFRVLVAEDGPDNRMLIKYHLRNAGLDAEFVENGLLAVEKIRAGERFDLIIMDMQMPVMDGYDATRTLRQEGCATPIMALTAHAMDIDRQKCLEAGCDAYERKPINKTSLLATITSLIESSHRAAA